MKIDAYGKGSEEHSNNVPQKSVSLKMMQLRNKNKGELSMNS